MRALPTQRGVVAVEAALLIAATMVLLPIVLYASQLIYHAIVLDKAVYAAARIVAALPEVAYAPSASSATLPALGSVHVDEAADDAALQRKPTGRSMVACDLRTCQHGIPGVMAVSTSVQFTDTVFDASQFEGVDFGTVDIAVVYLVTYAP
jgi:hypothetical protein